MLFGIISIASLSNFSDFSRSLISEISVKTLSIEPSSRHHHAQTSGGLRNYKSHSHHIHKHWEKENQESCH